MSSDSLTQSVVLEMPVGRASKPVIDLGRLRRVRKEQLHWAETGEIVIQFLPKVLRAGSGKRSEAWALIAEATGMTAQVLQRYMITLRTLRKIENAQAETLEPILKSTYGKAGGSRLAAAIDSFAKAEIAKRTYDLDPAEGLQLIRDVIVAGLTIQEAQRRYIDARNRAPRGGLGFVSLRSGKRNEAHAELEYLEQNLYQLYGTIEVRLYYSFYFFEHVRVDAVALAWQDRALRFVDAFVEVPTRGPASPDEYQDFLGRADYRSTFFRQLWLLTPENTAWDLTALMRDFDRLGLARVGLVQADGTGGARVLRRPTKDEEPPRYNSVLEAVMKKGIPDFAAE